MAIWLSQQREVRWNSVNHEKMCPPRIPIDDMWRRFTSVLSYPVSSSSKRKRETKNICFFDWLFFSQKCPLQNVSIQHIWCLLRKSSHFKRCLCLKGFFLYTSNTSKCEKNQLLICIYNQHNLEFVDSHTNKKREPLDIFEHILGQVPKIPPPQWYLCYFLLYKYALFYHHCLCLGLIFC